MRGTEARAQAEHDYRGITPACAGNRYFLAVNPLPGEDHPRVCGEQKSRLETDLDAIGSPPRVRGTESEYEDCGSDRRITPACAGNSLAWIDFSLLS